MTRPKVSVVLPARDAAGTVERAARSILAQTLSSLELLAVDDGSTDATFGVLENLAREDRRVRVLRTEPRGLVPALTAGLAECRAPFIARMDADDEALPERLEASLRALEEDPRLGAVGTQVELFRDDQPVSPAMQAYGAWLNSLTDARALFLDRLVESPLCHPSVTLRRAALDEVGGYRDGDVPEDWELWLRLIERGWRLRCVDQVLLRWKDHDHRLTRVDPRYGRDRHVLLRARHLARWTLEGRPCVVWGAGAGGLKLARQLVAHGAKVDGLVDIDPRKIGQRPLGVPVVSPEDLGPPRGRHLVAAVGSLGARGEIRAHLASRGWHEGVDFTCVA